MVSECVQLPIAQKIQAAEKILAHTFSDKALLQRALTHPSAVSESPTDSYERLEFLGDSVLGALVATEVYQRFPQMPEGGMTRIKISLISGSVLSSVAQELGLGELVIFGESELRSGHRGKVSALENCFEALTGALYLDAGLEAVEKWMLRTLGPLISEDVAASPENPKSILQEKLQSNGRIPNYRITGHEGPPHDRSFSAVVMVEGKVIGEGVGRSKREAEVAAAQVALVNLAE